MHEIYSTEQNIGFGAGSIQSRQQSTGRAPRNSLLVLIRHSKTLEASLNQLRVAVCFILAPTSTGILQGQQGIFYVCKASRILLHHYLLGYVSVTLLSSFSHSLA